MSLAVARRHLRPAATASSRSTSGGRAIATSSQTDQQEGTNKSTWTKIKLFLPPALLFSAGTERVFSLREKSELAEEWKSRLKREVLNCNEMDVSSSESLEFRKVKCKGVFDEKRSILVLQDSPTSSDPFAYHYSLITPFIPLPSHPQSVCSPLLVNRGRVPRNWADYRKIDKFQSLEIVRDFPQKEHLSSVSHPHEPAESLGVIRTNVMKLQKRLSSVSRHQPQSRHVELLGVVRSGVHTEWLKTDVGTLVRAVGLDPEATLFVEQIQDMSDGSSSDSANSVPTPYHEADLLGRFATMRKEHKEMILLWYCCSAGALYMARFLMRKPL